MIIKFALTIFSSMLVYKEGETTLLSDIYSFYKYLINKQDMTINRPLSANTFPFVVETYIRTAYIGQSDANPDRITLEARPNTGTVVRNIGFINKYPLAIINVLRTKDDLSLSLERPLRIAYLHNCYLYDLRNLFKRDPLLLLFPELNQITNEKLLEAIKAYEEKSGKETTIKLPLLKPNFDEYKQSQQDSFYAQQQFTKTPSEIIQTGFVEKEIDDGNLTDDEDETRDLSLEEERETLRRELSHELEQLNTNGSTNQILLNQAKETLNNLADYEIPELTKMRGRMRNSNTKLIAGNRKYRQNTATKRKKK